MKILILKCLLLIESPDRNTDMTYWVNRVLDEFGPCTPSKSL